MNTRTTGEAVTYLRRAHGLDIPALAVILNVTRPHLSDIEQDRCELTFLVARRLLAFTGLTIEEFSALLSDKELRRPEMEPLKYWQKKKERIRRRDF